MNQEQAHRMKPMMATLSRVNPSLRSRPIALARAIWYPEMMIIMRANAPVSPKTNLMMCARNAGTQAAVSIPDAKSHPGILVIMEVWAAAVIGRRSEGSAVEIWHSTLGRIGLYCAGKEPSMDTVAVLLARVSLESVFFYVLFPSFPCAFPGRRSGGPLLRSRLWRGGRMRRTARSLSA